AAPRVAREGMDRGRVPPRGPGRGAREPGGTAAADWQLGRRGGPGHSRRGKQRSGGDGWLIMPAIARGHSSDGNNPVLELFTPSGGVLADAADVTYQIFDVSDEGKRVDPVQVFP